MSIPLELVEVPEQIARFGAGAFLVTTGADGPPHVTSVVVRVEGEYLAVPAGRRTRANAAARPEVTLLWPAGVGGDLCLLVDGRAQPEPSDVLLVRPTSAVLHKVAGT